MKAKPNREDALAVCDVLHFGAALDSVDFIGKANVWIDDVDREVSVQVAQYIIGEALENTAPNQLSVLGYDSELSGVFAPFSSLAASEVGILELVYGEKELRARLDVVKQQIHAVQNLMQGTAKSLLEYRRRAGRPVERYQLIVLFMDMGLASDEFRSELSLLMRSGPAAGISFLVVSTTCLSVETHGGPDLALSVSDIAPNVCVIEPGLNDAAGGGCFAPRSIQEILGLVSKLAERAAKAALPVVRFADVHDLSLRWGESSAEGVTFTLGLYGTKPVEVTLGDEFGQRHNAVVTGAVGQGKSNLLSVIVHSLCLRYAPDELSLYLLDFKEGVTFKSFTNLDREEWLPQARVVGLESDASFGLAVLESLFAEYKRRMAYLKAHDARSIVELRRRDPLEKMPRIVVVIDEFQLMLADDLNESRKIANLLEKSVRLFRAAGIHFILSSQTLAGSMALAQMKESLFGQVPVRIALKNSLAESTQTLGMNNTAAAYLRPREAIVNLDYGEVSQNKKTTIAFADEAVLEPLRHRWWQLSAGSSRPPYVFESARRVHPADLLGAARQLSDKSGSPVALLGARISMDGALLAIPMQAEPGKNLAIVGTPEPEFDVAVGMMQAAALTLAAQQVDGEARFVFCDFTQPSSFDVAYPHFADAMSACGYFIEAIARDAFEGFLRSLIEEVPSDGPVYVFGLGLDRWQPASSGFGESSALQALAEQGPARGLHFFGQWSKASVFKDQVAGFGSADSFNTKLFLRIDEQSVQSLAGPYVRWTPQENRALAIDAVELAGELVFVPSIPCTHDDAREYARATKQGL